MNQRNRRVADELRRLLAELLQRELRDPRVGFVTVTDVKLSPDLRHAVVFVTVLGVEDPTESLQALGRAAPFLRHSLARQGRLRFTPDLRFVHDESVDSGGRIDELLERLRHERTEHDELENPSTPGEDTP